MVLEHNNEIKLLKETFQNFKEKNNQRMLKNITNNIIVKIELLNNFHDKFIIIDEKTLYHCGAIFKDLGKKCFTINKIEDSTWLNRVL